MQAESRQALVAWTRQFGSVLALYLLALILTAWAATAKIANPEKVMFLLAPIVPGLYMIWLTVNSYRRSDEFIQLRILKAGSLAAVVVAAFALVYNFLEILGFPYLSTYWMSNIVWAVFVPQMLKLLVTGK